MRCGKQCGKQLLTGYRNTDGKQKRSFSILFLCSKILKNFGTIRIRTKKIFFPPNAFLRKRFFCV